MEFNAIRLVGNATHQITLPLYPNPSTAFDKYVCKGIEGLDPPAVDIHLSETPRFPGLLQSRHAVSREIVLRMGLNPFFTRVEGGPQTFRDIRSDMYRTLLAGNFKGEVTIQLLNSTTPVAQIKGYVRQLEASVFIKDPEVQISFICPNSYLESPTITDLVNLGTATAPEFQNDSDVPVGFTMTVVFTSTLSAFSLIDPHTDRNMSLTRSFPSGSTLTLDTRPGNRSILLISGGVHNLLGALSSGSEWLMLEPGLNEFIVSSGAYTLVDGHYTKTWWGV